MQHTEIEQDQQDSRQQISDLKDDVDKLAAQRESLEQENHRHSLLVQKMGKYMGFGAAGKLEWICFKLKFKQEELARLKGIALLLSMMPAASESTQQKMERMVTENPSELAVHIRHVYQPLIKAEQQLI